MFAQGFAIKKELINGKPVKETGIMGEFNKQGARIVEMNNGKAKYTELSHDDIKKLIGMRSNTDNLIQRLTPLLKPHTRHYVHHHRKNTRRHRRTPRHRCTPHHRRTPRHRHKSHYRHKRTMRK